jgi:hypothetical protein
MSEGAVPRTGRTLLPVGLAMLAERQPRADWVARFSDTKLLLVRLEDPNGEIALGMLSSPTEDGEPVEASMGGRTGNTSSLPLASPAGYLKRPPKLDGAALRARLAGDCYFVAPLRKRRLPGRLVTSKIWVGRSESSDIVLRHEGVSKAHAWFERDDEGTFYLGDARSRNATYVNDTLLGREMLPVRDGDKIRFGTVHALVCAPFALWDALHPEHGE